MIGNSSTLGDLVNKTKEWSTEFLCGASETIEVSKKDYDKKYFTLYYKSDGKVHSIEKLRTKEKLSDLKKTLEKNHGAPAAGKAFKLMFADGVTDVQSYTDKR
jgi:hypothetical protein